MYNDFTDFIKSVRDSLLSLSVVLALYGIIERLFMPKQTKIIVDDGVPAELTVLGKKGNPKAVYVSTQKHHVKFRGAILLGIMAYCINEFIKKYEEEHKVSVKED